MNIVRIYICFHRIFIINWKSGMFLFPSWNNLKRLYIIALIKHLFLMKCTWKKRCLTLDWTAFQLCESKKWPDRALWTTMIWNSDTGKDFGDTFRRFQRPMIKLLSNWWKSKAYFAKGLADLCSGIWKSLPPYICHTTDISLSVYRYPGTG